jgi:iron complex outermembrane receptor protein
MVSGRQRRRAGRAGLNGEALTVTWSVADLGAATTKDVQTNQRLSPTPKAASASGTTRPAWSYGRSQPRRLLRVRLRQRPGTADGLKNGQLNPFGLQDARPAAPT